VIRLSKLADYGIIIMTHLARGGGRSLSTSEIASATSVPQPMAGKILKALARAELLVSHRGAYGGYGLEREPSAISVAEIIEALDGPIALTACIDAETSDCTIERLCPTRTNWQRINGAIREALDGVTLDEMAFSIPWAFLPDRVRQATGEAGVPNALGDSEIGVS
jgi:FeS assembly SUF system regulator